MRIERIKMRGIASFREEIEIDFTQEPFSSSGIFVISGPTGAGKSTILDAITLALYHKTPRLHGKGDRNPQNIINLHVEEGFVEVTFSVRGERYQAKYVMRRGKNPKASLVKLPEGEVLAERSVDVERVVRNITGMDFESFRRAVVLPQGEFTAFLKADSDKKREILEAVTGIDIYERLKDLYNERRGKLEKEVKRAEDILEERKATLGKISLGEVEERLQEVREERRRGEERLKVLKDRLKEMERLLNHQKELEDLLKKEGELAGDERRIKDLESRIKLLERSVGEMRGDYDYLRRLKVEVDKRRDELEELKRRVQETKVRFERIKEAGQKRMDTLKREREEVKAYLERGKALRRLSPLLERYRLKKKVLEELKRREEEVGKALRGERGELNQVLGELKRGYSSHIKYLGDLEKRVESLNEKVRELERKLDEVRWKNMAFEIRSGLKEGDVCPVCGGEYHSERAPGIVPEDLKGVEGALKESQEELKRWEGALHRARSVVDLFPEEVRMGEGEEEREISGEWVRGAVGRLASLNSSIKRREEELRGVREEIRKVGEELKEIERELRAAGVVDVERAIEEIDSLALDKMEKRFEEINDEMDKIREVEREAERDLVLRRKEVEVKENDLSGFLRDLKRRERAFLERINKFGYRNMAEFESALEEYGGIHRMREEVERYRNEREHVRRRVEELRRLLGEVRVKEEEVMKLRKEERELEERIGNLRKEEGELGQRLKDLKERRKLLQEAEGRYKELKKQQEVWEALGTLMKSNRLRDYALEMVLGYLLEVANNHLNFLSQGRYLFSAEEGRILTSLKVMDMWAGGERRPVETLSGGEQFLASLSLALALSEMSARRGEVGSLFLDEGFGTLDTRSLEMVLDALERLKSEGRVIGVISHIDEVKRRIPVRVLVKKSPEGARVRIHPPPAPA